MPEPVRIYQVGGELHVDIVKPMTRFGSAIHIYKREGGKIWHARPNEEGELIMTELSPHSYPDKPTMYLDDDLIQKLRDALNGQPYQERGGAELDHLKDAIDMRNRLMGWVEKLALAPRILIPPGSINNPIAVTGLDEPETRGVRAE